MAASASKEIVLKSEKDWESWIWLMERTAQQGRIWQYVNPDGDGGTPRAPARPTIQDVRTEQVEVNPARPNATPPIPATYRDPVYEDLDPVQREHFRSLTKEYDDDKAEYKLQVKNIDQLWTKIIEQTDSEHVLYTKGKDVREVLGKLRDKFKPTDYTRRKTVLDTWGKLQRAKHVHDYEKYITTWLYTYNELEELKQPKAELVTAAKRF